MRAIVQDKYGSPEILHLRDIEKPAVRDNDVLIRVHAAGFEFTRPASTQVTGRSRAAYRTLRVRGRCMEWASQRTPSEVPM
jgi:hypothetical protein